ncbi:MAG: hypothetical protein ACI4G1_08360 [Ruminococcus sp.]
MIFILYEIARLCWGKKAVFGKSCLPGLRVEAFCSGEIASSNW